MHTAQDQASQSGRGPCQCREIQLTLTLNCWVPGQGFDPPVWEHASRGPGYIRRIPTECSFVRPSGLRQRQGNREKNPSCRHVY